MNDGRGARLAFRSVLAVCAHPDDESFGLGAALSTFSSWGVETSLLCFTHGEASTLGQNRSNLAVIRADELTAALGPKTWSPAGWPPRPTISRCNKALDTALDGRNSIVSRSGPRRRFPRVVAVPTALRLS